MDRTHPVTGTDSRPRLHEEAHGRGEVCDTGSSPLTLTQHVDMVLQPLICLANHLFSRGGNEDENFILESVVFFAREHVLQAIRAVEQDIGVIRVEGAPSAWGSNLVNKAWVMDKNS